MARKKKQPETVLPWAPDDIEHIRQNMHIWDDAGIPRYYINRFLVTVDDLNGQIRRAYTQGYNDAQEMI